MTKEDIKQICQIYDNFRSERDAATIAYNSDDTFWEHILATYNLSQPSLPSNLDEAAENSWAVYEYRESPRGLYSTCYLDGFKDGAEWMAGQGEVQEHFVIGHTEESQGHPAIVCYPESFGIGDKVIVQIRKKEESK